MSATAYLAIAIAALVFITSGLAGQLASTKAWHRWTFWGVGFLTLILIFIQIVISEREKPLTLREAQDLFSKSNPQFVPLPTLPTSDATKPITKAEFIKLLQQYGPHAAQGVAGSPIVAPAMGQPQAAPSHPQEPSRPEIMSAPKIFSDGQITGKNFGSVQQELYLHLRVKPSARRGDYAENYDLLLGGLSRSNYVLLRDGVQLWGDTVIQLTGMSNQWRRLLDQMKSRAQSRRISPPGESDIEACYQIGIIPDGPSSNLFCVE